MTSDRKPVVTMSDLPMEDFSQGTAYHSRDGLIADALGLTQIGAIVTEVEPGKSACPCHVHHVEDELFIILDGEGTYRFGNETYAVKAGDCLGAPAGDISMAHKLTNTGDKVLRYLALSSKAEFDVCEYPDSGKFLVSSRRGKNTPFRFVGRQESEVDYWDGEESAS